MIETLTRLRQFDEAPYSSHLIVLVALVRHVQMGTTDNSLAQPLTQPHIKAGFERDKKFGRFATNIYFASLQLTSSQIASAMEVEQEQIVFSWLSGADEEHCPKFMVITDHETASVVLIIRGTLCFKDILMDVVCEEAEFLDGVGHEGFLSGSRMILEKCSSVLERTLREHLGYELVVCGHSMGGSVAEMLTLELLEDHSQQILPPGVSVHCVALGPAPVYRARSELADLYRERVRIYINDRDVVPHLSLGSVANFLVVLREIDNLGLTLDEQLAVIMWRQDEETVSNRERVRRVASSAQQDQFDFLHHPGQVTRVFSSGEDIALEEQSPEQGLLMAENLEIFETMISDHLHTSYRFNLNKGSFQNKTIAKLGYLAQASILLPLYGPVFLRLLRHYFAHQYKGREGLTFLKTN